ncbi:MAG: metal-dependent hydrolase [Burkholderiaceae bacterium]
MDSLTQIALGSAVGVAVMGRRTAVWKAALWGAIGGTLPDLDVVIDHGNPVLNMVRHRAESHSLFYLTLLAPLLAWVAARCHRRADVGPHPAAEPQAVRVAGDWRRYYRRWWLALWLVLVTHPLLDTMTVYGTQLLVPFSRYPFGVGSVFIIDPAYTLMLLVGVGAALWRRNARGLRWNAVALTLATLYLGWSMVAQHRVATIARASWPVPDVTTGALLVTPAPFNTLLWRLVVTTPNQYFEGYYAFLDPEPTVRWTAHPRGADLIEQHGKVDAVRHIAAFSHGFFKLQTSADGHVLLTDLRMGQEPDYSFTFDLGEPAQVGTAPIGQQRMRADIGKALPWLWQRLLGRTQTTLADARPAG